MLLFAAPMAFAQTTPQWDTSARGKASFTQAGFYRWHDGGVSSLALSVGLTGKAGREGSRWNQEHEAQLAYGLVKQNGLDVRKAEDVIHVHLSFSNTDHLFLGKIHPSLAVDLRSQFSSGYDYSKATAPVRISGFLAPATFVETLGINVDQKNYANAHLGIAAKQTLVTDQSLRSRYKVRESSVIRNELGLSTIIKVDHGIFPNVHLDQTIQLFASFNQPNRPDLLSETLITMTVNRWLHVNLEYVAKLDRDVARSIQMKELLSLGISFVLI